MTIAGGRLHAARHAPAQLRHAGADSRERHIAQLVDDQQLDCVEASCRRCTQPPRRNPLAHDLDNGSTARTSPASVASPAPHTHARSCSRRYTLAHPAAARKYDAPCAVASCERGGRLQEWRRSTPYKAPASWMPAVRAGGSPAELKN